MKMRFFLSFILTSCLCSTFFASNNSGFRVTGKIEGKVVGTEGEALSFANVLLYQTSDSAMVKAEFTEDDGSFVLSNIAAGTYWINVTYVGLPEKNTKVFEVLDGQVLTLPNIQLTSEGVDLTEVVVRSTRPIVEVHADKTVFNVDGSINATGNDAMQLLRKAPGVVVDNNDNIILSGKNGVQVYINGKPTQLGASDLAAYLKTVQSTEIDNIEIITNPSAKWDAEGNAGIINIRMKKDKRLGANGNFNAGYGRGDFNSYNASLSGNYRNKKMNAFGRFGFNDNRSSNWFNLYREQNGLSYDQQNPQTSKNESQNFRLGTDFFLNEKSTLGFLVNGYTSKNSEAHNSRMFIRQVGMENIDSSLIANTRASGDNENMNFNLNYVFDNGKGVTWNLDADYGFFSNHNENFTPNYIISGNGLVGNDTLSKEIFRTVAPTDIDIYTLKVDHERPLGKGMLSAGAKISYVRTDNDFQFFNVIEGVDVPDVDRTNLFVYDENVNAVYGKYSQQFGKIGIQAGLRVEQTNSEGDLTALKQVNDKNVKRDYLDFFPSGGVNMQVNEKNQLALSYSRRIDRPSYQNLNPFEYRLDKLTFQQGNPFLTPQYTHNIQLTHTFLYRFNTSISYSHTTDLITDLTFIDDVDPSASLITSENLGEQSNISLNISAPFTIKQWWNVFANFSGYRTNNQGMVRGQEVDLTVWAYNLYAQSSFVLPKGFTAEISGWYSSPSVWGGTFETDRMGSIDAGLQKKLMNDKATIKVSVSDIFKTNEWNSESFFGPLYLRAAGGWDSRRLNVNFSYRFGNDQVKQARRRSTGLEDEKNRAN